MTVAGRDVPVQEFAVVRFSREVGESAWWIGNPSSRRGLHEAMGLIKVLALHR